MTKCMQLNMHKTDWRTRNQMQFTDLTFLFIFMPILLASYYIVKPQHRKYILLAFSLMFYACGSNMYFLLLCSLIILNSLCAHIIVALRNANKPKISGVFLFLGIAGNIAVLAGFKYYKLLGLSFGTLDTLLPLGLSFFTFKAVSYLADLYNGKIEKVSFVDQANYLSFFAQIQSGPIERYNDYIEDRKFSTEMFSKGIARFMIGVSKKVIIADTLGNVVSEIFDSTPQLTTGLAWLGAISYALQLYVDFSGYSDMAIGIGKMLGIECPENFNYPYMTKSVAEFWRRWHISLGSWFKDYVYIPLGGSRKGQIRTYINLLIVWILTGIWHGTGLQFIVWGLAYGFAIIIEKACGFPGKIKSKTATIIYRIAVLLYIDLLWVFFRSNSLSSAVSYIKTMFVLNAAENGTLRTRFLIRDYYFFIVVAILMCIPIANSIKNKLCTNSNRRIIYDIISGALIVCAFIVALSFIVGGLNNPFLYMNF